MNKSIFNSNSSVYVNYGYLMLPINLCITPKIKIGTDSFFAKNGYHVSLLCLKKFSEPERIKILHFAQKYPIKINKISKIYRLVMQGNQQSIIVRVRLSGLKRFISAVNEHYGFEFVYPPTHITLFTLKGQYGIGVDSINEYRQLTRQINQKDSQRLQNSFKLI